MDTKHIEDSLLEVDEALAKISDLQAASDLIQADLNNTSAKELATMDDDSLPNDVKTQRILELRVYGEVVKGSLLKAHAALYAAEDIAISAGINANNSLGGFRDALRTAALREASVIADEVFLLAKGESEHWAARARKVHTLDRIEALNFVGNNRPNSSKHEVGEQIPKAGIRHPQQLFKSVYGQNKRFCVRRARSLYFVKGIFD
jgi:hypothetical protein